MKISARLAIAAAFLLLAAASLLAQNSGPSANGSFQFSTGGHPLTIAFDARTHANGSTRGHIALSGTANIADQDVDGDGSSSPGALVSLSIEVDVDCLNVSGSGAILGGVIKDANVPAYVGHRALLAVVDNGEGKKGSALDQFMWGVYGTPDLTWVPSDAELAFDPGVGLTWHATDFEREDDAGVPSHASSVVDCQTFSAAAYSFEDVPHGGGNIQVKP